MSLIAPSQVLSRAPAGSTDVPEHGQALRDLFRPPSSQAAEPEVVVLDGWRVPYPYRERPFGITAASDVQWVLDKITPQPINTL